MAIIKDKKEIKILQTGGRILAKILAEISRAVKVGVSTEYLNNLAELLIKEAGAEPSFKGFGDFNPYPKSLCTSVNDGVVHCVPSETQLLKSGDIVGLDLGIRYPAVSGLYTDKAITIGIGKVSPEAKRLIKVARNSLELLISKLKPGMTTGEAGLIIQSYVESQGFSVVRELIGHGVGYSVHELPHLPNYGKKGEGDVITEGMVLAFEPMINIGSWQVKFGENGWDVYTKDGSLSAHFENTILITKKGCEVITK